MSLFTEAHLTRARINSGMTLSLTYPERLSCCNCGGELRYKLACGFKKKDKSPQWACSRKCREAFYSKAQEEEDDGKELPPIIEKKPFSDMYEELRKRQERGILAMFDDDEPIKGVKITDTYRDYQTIEWKKKEEEEEKDLCVDDFNPSRYTEEID
jgi:hypothetical protein